MAEEDWSFRWRRRTDPSSIRTLGSFPVWPLTTVSLSVFDVCLSVYLYLWLKVSVCMFVFVYLFVCLFVCLSVYLYVCLCMFVSVSLPVCLVVGLCPSVHLSVCLSFRLSVCLSVRLSARMTCHVQNISEWGNVNYVINKLFKKIMVNN